jgi:hypothetical protein
MTANQITSSLTVFIAIPVTGVALYAWLCTCMQRRGIPEPPFVTYFVLFAHGGIWFLLLLTSYLWGWSGMSSLGALYLIFISPFPVGVFAFALHDERRDSVFHAIAYWFCLGYVFIIIGFFATWITYCHVTQC